ncbi:DnaJ C-terminal domain-containing protein [Streptomyces sp. RKAG290]|uniref:DnaJ C-terminal domain-containing protein n=1 Tax=Streptomyces sp. RKAG290 TaxID=2888348 RepID=UPI0027E2D6E2|nr:DnaJ C-terminal domain-containing protein [Streptomyces sp. RKAG290]
MDGRTHWGRFAALVAVVLILGMGVGAFFYPRAAWPSAAMALLLGACWFSVRGVRAGRPVRARLVLTPDQALVGGTRTVGFRARARCTHCAGAGVRGVGTGRRCLWCHGSGLGMPGRRAATVRIPAGVQDGSTLRVPGRGTPGKGGDPAGDLLLSVRISGTRTRRAAPPGSTVGSAPPGSRTGPVPSAARTGTAPRPRTGTAPPRPRSGAAGAGGAGTGPVSVRADGIRVTVDQQSVTVREERRSPTGRTSWVTTHELRWSDIALLVFDSDRHDAVVALYAIPADASGTGQRRQHLVDARQLRAEDWQVLADAVERHTHGRIALDHAPRRSPGGLRDS